MVGVRFQPKVRMVWASLACAPNLNVYVLADTKTRFIVYTSGKKPYFQGFKIRRNFYFNFYLNVEVPKTNFYLNFNEVRKTNFNFNLKR